MDRVSPKMEMLSREYVNEQTEIIFCKNDRDREEHIATADVLVTFTNGISKDWIEKAERCRFIQKLGAGVNNIDIKEASKRGIPVANTVGLNATSVAEHTVMLMLATYKHLVQAHTAIAKESRWLKTELRDRSYELSYKKIGLIGFGNIGKKVSQLLSGFQCDVSYFDILRLTEKEEEELGISYKTVDELVTSCDVISLHVPLTEKTRHLIDEKKLAMMKPEAILVNTCRGGIVDEHALYQALKSGRLTGAGLDVFENEPIDQSHLLTGLPNVIVTPHIGGGTNEAMEAVASEAYYNINAFLYEGALGDVKNVVNREAVGSLR
nr:2-hydroxyacid dehydrogenase [Halalkalibacter oceani]